MSGRGMNAVEKKKKVEAEEMKRVKQRKRYW
jgi:hypothetical protein